MCELNIVEIDHSLSCLFNYKDNYYLAESVKKDCYDRAVAIEIKSLVKHTDGSFRTDGSVRRGFLKNDDRNTFKQYIEDFLISIQPINTEKYIKIWAVFRKSSYPYCNNSKRIFRVEYKAYEAFLNREYTEREYDHIVLRIKDEERDSFRDYSLTLNDKELGLYRDGYDTVVAISTDYLSAIEAIQSVPKTSIQSSLKDIERSRKDILKSQSLIANRESEIHRLKKKQHNLVEKTKNSSLILDYELPD